MKNQRSTVAMQIAHKIAKQFPKATFATCLTHAWAIVKHDMVKAQDIAENAYNITIEYKRNKFVGNANVVVFKKKGIKNAFKRLWNGIAHDMAVSRW